MRRIENLIGKKFGRLLVQKFDCIKNNNYYWICKCDCGNEKSIASGHLKSGRTKSCGCYNREIVSAKCGTHHLTKTRIYKIWRGMIDRCYYPSHKYYKDYGGRGIKICDEWKNDFYKFYVWANQNGYNPNAKRGECTIDRINNDGNYEPNNCRWVNLKEQQNNTRIVKKFYFCGEFLTLYQISKITGIKKSIIYKRLYRGWDMERATKQKIRKGEKQC